MPQIVYDLKGYPQFVYTAQDFAEQKARKQPDIKQLANLLIRSIFEDGGLGRVLSIDEVTPGTPANGWTIRFTGETNGRTADPYIAIYDGQAISYNDDPSRQPRNLSEGLALALEFAAKKDGKNCNKGKPCGGSCIAKGRNCRKDKKDLTKNQQQAADTIVNAGSGQKQKTADSIKAMPDRAGVYGSLMKKPGGQLLDREAGLLFNRVKALRNLRDSQKARTKGKQSPLANRTQKELKRTIDKLKEYDKAQVAKGGRPLYEALYTKYS